MLSPSFPADEAPAWGSRDPAPPSPPGGMVVELGAGEGPTVQLAPQAPRALPWEGPSLEETFCKKSCRLVSQPMEPSLELHTETMVLAMPQSGRSGGGKRERGGWREMERGRGRGEGEKEGGGRWREAGERGGWRER